MIPPNAYYDEAAGEVRYEYRPRTIRQWMELEAYIKRRVTQAEGHWIASDALGRPTIEHDETAFWDWRRLLANVQMEIERRVV